MATHLIFARAVAASPLCDQALEPAPAVRHKPTAPVRHHAVSDRPVPPTRAKNGPTTTSADKGEVCVQQYCRSMSGSRGSHHFLLIFLGSCFGSLHHKLQLLFRNLLKCGGFLILRSVYISCDAVSASYAISTLLSAPQARALAAKAYSTRAQSTWT